MIDDFNSQLREFCARYPDVLEYIEINDTMRQAHPDPLVDIDVDVSTTSTSSDTTRGLEIIMYYSSGADGDGANVHPTWERTYLLWIDKLRRLGVDVDTFPKVSLDELEAALADYTTKKGDRLQTSSFRTAA